MWMTGDEGLFSTIFRAILLCCFLMDNGYNIETCKIIGSTSLWLHFCHMRDFFHSSKGRGHGPSWSGPMVNTPLLSREPREYPRKPYTTRNKSHWATSSPVGGDSVGLFSFQFCGGLLENARIWNRMRNGRSRSSKVVDSGTNRKRIQTSY